MAILSKIRERSLFLILVIGLALFAFVLDPSTLTDFFNSQKINEVGQVNGESISRQEFAQALDNYRAQTGNRVSEMQAAKNVWDNLVRQKIYDSQLAEAGITVGEADILNDLYEKDFIKNDPKYQTTGIFDKAKFKEFLATIRAENGEQWKAWREYMSNVKNALQKTTYDNLVAAGLGASLEEGKTEYLNENTKMSGELVYLPFTTMADSLVQITKGDVKKYIESHASEFEVEASRDINYVKFDIKATPQDENDIKAEVAELINDSDKGVGLKNTTDYLVFLEETKSELPYNDNIQFKVQVPQVIADTLFKGNVGDVYGPYKDQDFFKLSKITEVIQIPDSAQARHILIPMAGAPSADPTVTNTETQAKNLADSLLNVLKKDKSKFEALVKEFSSDKGSVDKGGFYDWFPYSQMTPAFRDYVFEGKEGDLGVVKSVFGFHVIEIKGQKNFQKALKLATYARKIIASEATENDVYQKAESFAQELSNGGNIETLAKDKKLMVSPAEGLKALDENIPSLGTERQIISWAFGKDLKIGDFKRFDIENGYVVATLRGKTEKGLMPVDKAIARVRPILVKEKKAELLKEKLQGSSLNEIITATKQPLKKFSDVTLKSPTITGIGYEPKIVGAMLTAKENELKKNIVGDRGVYAFVVKSRELPTELPNYDTYRKRIANQRKNQTYNMYQAVKKASDIEDEVGSTYYGVGQ
ncbi:peptidylprolyl isomerase [Tenacibaculum jejuense]|uniref:Periplasmic chaperone PpiD n=1 Tax=Tenacibaculum jejuense TaxID=584609 RepID=A0A238UEZ0_9FLAO|nr:peptidylprolyl isomerase [Tenacibaculum jejuense]SNR17148.1 Peptidylprolyl isomerase [Tenacibaculum jejuense]